MSACRLKLARLRCATLVLELAGSCSRLAAVVGRSGEAGTLTARFGSSVRVSVVVATVWRWEE